MTNILDTLEQREKYYHLLIDILVFLENKKDKDECDKYIIEQIRKVVNK